MMLIVPDYIRFGVNDETIGQVTPSDGGFWEIGQFSSQVGNVDKCWEFGSKMAPFDQPVSIFLQNAKPSLNFYELIFINFTHTLKTHVLFVHEYNICFDSAYFNMSFIMSAYMSPLC
jgi:hypothetical protein